MGDQNLDMEALESLDWEDPYPGGAAALEAYEDYEDPEDGDLEFEALDFEGGEWAGESSYEDPELEDLEVGGLGLGEHFEADYQVFPPDTRKLIRNTRKVPFRRICKLEMPKGSCTGTLVGPNKILTAAHCIYSRGKKKLRRRIRVIPGKNGKGRSRRAEPFGSAMVRTIRFPRRYRTAKTYWAAAPYDYAVLTLKRRLGRRTGWFRRIRQISPKILKRVRVNTAGYPGDKGGQRQFMAYDRILKVRGPFLEYRHDTFFGQSGSVIWLRQGKKRTIIGIHKRGDDTRSAPVANLGVRITPRVLRDLRRWI